MKYLLFTLFCSVFGSLAAQNAWQPSHQVFQTPLWQTGAAKQLLQLDLRQAVQPVPGLPRQAQISYQSPWQNRVGFGAWVAADEAASLQHFSGGMQYAAAFGSRKFKFQGLLSVAAGQQRLSPSVWNNPLNDIEDPRLADKMAGNSYAQAGAGLSVFIHQQWFMSLRFPALMQRELGTTLSPVQNKANFNAFRFQTGYIKALRGDSHLRIMVDYLQSETQPQQIAVWAGHSFMTDRIEIGAQCKHNGSTTAGPFASIGCGALRFIYSFEASLGKTNQYQTGQHALSLQWRLTARQRQFDRSIPFKRD